MAIGFGKSELIPLGMGINTSLSVAALTGIYVFVYATI
jgi:hypothetical protein